MTIQKPQQQPDVEGNSENGLPDGGLPMGSAVQGMTGGSRGDASAADVVRGYSDIGDGSGGMKGQREGDELSSPPMQPGGFCGRPGGWER